MLDLLCFSHCCFPMTTKAVKYLILWNAVQMLCSKPFDLLLNSSNIMSSGYAVAVFSLFDLYLNSLHCYVMSQQESQQLTSGDYKQVVLSWFYCSFFLIFYKSTKPINLLPVLVEDHPPRASLLHSSSLYHNHLNRK